MKRFLVLAAVLTMLTACSSGPPVVTAKNVSQEAESQLRKQNPKITAGTMKCPELVGEVGREIRCVRSAHIGIWDVTLKGTVTATKVDGDQVEFAIKMDDHIASYAADRKTNESILAESLKIDGKQISCPDAISGKVGSVGYCVGTDSKGKKHRIKMTVKSADLNASEINYSYEVID